MERVKRADKRRERVRETKDGPFHSSSCHIPRVFRSSPHVIPFAASGRSLRVSFTPHVLHSPLRARPPDDDGREDDGRVKGQ